ncbi:MAG TPA: hypothetical protein VGC14_05880 [Rhizobium sp.]
MLMLDRLALYELVWTRPLRDIAQRHDLNPVRLAGMCDEYDVPRPPAGYWQKRQYGKTVEKPPLECRHFSFKEIVIVPCKGNKGSAMDHPTSFNKKAKYVHARNLHGQGT